MTKSKKGSAESPTDATLSWRDWVLLPALSLLTISLMVASTEWMARRMFAMSSSAEMTKCLVQNDPSGARAIPNSVCWDKNAETQPVEYRFNNCGHRDAMDCGPKPAGSFRIVLIGSSVALGERVERERTLASILPAELSRMTGHKVELYNEGMGLGFSHSVAMRFNDALAANPDMVLWLLTPMDIGRASDVVAPPDISDRDRWHSRSLLEKAWLRIKDDIGSKSIMVAISDMFGRTRTALMLRHFLYQSQSQYVKSYLAGPDYEVGFLKTDLSEEWKGHIQQFAKDAAEIEDRAKAAGIPFVAVFTPSRAQGAMISMGEWAKGFDPYRLSGAIGSIITSHGGGYVDISPDFRNIPNPEQYYLPVDSHPDAEGQAIFARLVAKDLINGLHLALSVDAQAQAAIEQSR